MRTFASCAALLGLLLAGCTATGVRPETKSVALGRYVAIGSSMAAGPGLGPLKPGTPRRCTRTFANFPTVLAEKMRLTLVDVTCSGATTDDVLGPWKELPAQIDAVTPDTRLVTVTIGGNDLDYVGGLFAASCRPDGTIVVASGQAFPCPPDRTPTEGDFAKVETNLREIARQVKARAPQARLLFVEYLRLVPETPCAATPLSEEHAARARTIGQRLADITAKVARRSGATLIPVHDLSAGHTPCDAEPYVNGYPPGYDGSDGAPWHPNRAGMAKVAEWVEAALKK